MVPGARPELRGNHDFTVEVLGPRCSPLPNGAVATEQRRHRFDNTNLVAHHRYGQMELDPHLDGSCVLSLEEDSARVLVEALREWWG